MRMAMILTGAHKNRIVNIESEERYIWDCHYCGRLCESLDEYPEEQESPICEHCGKESKCILTNR